MMTLDKEYDYAHMMFAECAGHDPANLEYVEAMLENLQAKYGDKPKRPRAGGFGGGRAMKKALGRKDWPQVLRLGIEALKANPWHVSTLRGMAEACAQLHYNVV